MTNDSPTSDSDTADPRYGLRHGDVRIGKPRESPRFLISWTRLASAVPRGAEFGGPGITSHRKLDFFEKFPTPSSLLSMLPGEPPRRSPITGPSSCHGRELDSGRDRGYRRANTDEEFAQRAAALERLFKFNGHQPQNW